MRLLFGVEGVRSLFGRLRGAIAVWGVRECDRFWEVGGVRCLES